jgi:hypothetical protein
MTDQQVMQIAMRFQQKRDWAGFGRAIEAYVRSETIRDMIEVQEEHRMRTEKRSAANPAGRAAATPRRVIDPALMQSLRAAGALRAG